MVFDLLTFNVQCENKGYLIGEIVQNNEVSIIDDFKLRKSLLKKCCHQISLKQSKNNNLQSQKQTSNIPLTCSQLDNEAGKH